MSRPPERDGCVELIVIVEFAQPPTKHKDKAAAIAQPVLLRVTFSQETTAKIPPKTTIVPTAAGLGPSFFATANLLTYRCRLNQTPYATLALCHATVTK
jgi:hypothetical protein